MNWAATHWFNSGLDKIEKRCILPFWLTTFLPNENMRVNSWKFDRTQQWDHLWQLFSALLVRSAIVMVDNSPQHACVSLPVQIAVSFLWGHWYKLAQAAFSRNYHAIKNPSCVFLHKAPLLKRTRSSWALKTAADVWRKTILEGIQKETKTIFRLIVYLFRRYGGSLKNGATMNDYIPFYTNSRMVCCYQLKIEGKNWLALTLVLVIIFSQSCLGTVGAISTWTNDEIKAASVWYGSVASAMFAITKHEAKVTNNGLESFILATVISFKRILSNVNPLSLTHFTCSGYVINRKHDKMCLRAIWCSAHNWVFVVISYKNHPYMDV